MNWTAISVSDDMMCLWWLLTTDLCGDQETGSTPGPECTLVLTFTPSGPVQWSYPGGETRNKPPGLLYNNKLVFCNN